MDPLDNVVWHALGGRQHRFCLRRGRAARYRPDVAPFAGVPDDPRHADWDDLRVLAGDESVVLFRMPVPIPDDWQEVQRFPCLQMAWPDAPRAAVADPEIVTLSGADVPEMIDLVRRTEPGPFLAETIQLGTYLGIRQDGELAAMTGERFRIDGATEISAVCTDPRFRGRGLARRLLVTVAAGIARRGEVPFLHVVDDNTPAISLYDSVGFVTQRRPVARVLRPPGACGIGVAPH